MKRKRYTEEPIISILMEYQARASVPDSTRHHGAAENTVYRWKSKFGGMKVSEARRLRELERENAKLKRLLADAELDSHDPVRPGQAPPMFVGKQNPPETLLLNCRIDGKAYACKSPSQRQPTSLLHSNETPATSIRR